MNRQLFYFLFYVKLMSGESVTYFYVKGGRGYPAHMNTYNTLGIDIGSTTVKIAILDKNQQLLFADYERHYANIQETLAGLLKKAYEQLGPMDLVPSITGDRKSVV